MHRSARRLLWARRSPALRIEAVQFCVTFVGAWLTAVGPDVVARLTLAAQAAVAGRACTRPLRLAAEILILRTLLRTLRALPAAERPTVLRERATQDVALAFTVVATARAVDLWKLGADATVAAIDVLPARAIVEAALRRRRRWRRRSRARRRRRAARRSAAPFLACWSSTRASARSR